MSMRSLETAILAELREVTKKRSLRIKDIMEWSSGSVKVALDETALFLPGLKINCAVKTALVEKKKSKKADVPEGV